MPRNLFYFPYGFRTFSIKPSRRSIFTKFSVILVDAIRTLPFIKIRILILIII